MVVAAALLATACATLVSGTREEVTVRSEPLGATVRLTPGRYEATTPATFDLPRGEAPYLVTVALDGYAPHEGRVRSRVNRWTLWNVVFPGTTLLVLVDWATGALWDLEPDELDVVLEPAAGAQP